MIILYLENDDYISNFFFKLFQAYGLQFRHISRLENCEDYLSVNQNLKDDCLLFLNAVIDDKDMFSYSIYIKRKYQLSLPIIAYSNHNMIDNAIRAKQSEIDYFFPLPVLPYDIISCIDKIKNDLTIHNKNSNTILELANPSCNNTVNKGISIVFKEYLDRYFASHSTIEPSAGLYDRIMEEIEPQIILSSLKYTNGNRIKAADILGINRNTLRKKMNQYKINALSDA